MSNVIKKNWNSKSNDVFIQWFYLIIEKDTLLFVVAYMVLICYNKKKYVFFNGFSHKGKLLWRGVLVALIHIMKKLI